MVVAILAVMALPVISAGAEITIDGFTSWASNGNPSSYTFNASGSDKLVVVVSGEHNFPGNYTGDIYNVKYDGQLLTKAVEQAPASGLSIQTTSDIWYLDNPWQYTTAGTIVVSVNGNGTNYVYTAVGLSNTAPGVGATAHVSGAASVDLTTTAADSMVIFNLGTGGSGNTAGGTNTILPNSPAGAVQIDGKVSSGSYAGQSVARATIISPGLRTYSFNTNKTDVVTIAAEFLPGVPHNLTLRVDPVTGATTILGDATRLIAINYYQVTSAAHSLDSANWTSLADQDFEGGGPPKGTGNGWEEAGGAGSGALAEAYLLGDSTIARNQSVSLGKGYNPDVGAEDLVFTYLTDSGKVIEGHVEYVTSALPGDANLDGVVDAADFIALKKSFGTAFGAKYGEGDFDLDRDVDRADLAILMGSFGQAGNAATAPEPAAMALLGIGGLALLRRRRARLFFARLRHRNQVHGCAVVDAVLAVEHVVVQARQRPDGISRPLPWFPPNQPGPAPSAWERRRPWRHVLGRRQVYEAGQVAAVPGDL
jgi:hypothetical protein